MTSKNELRAAREEILTEDRERLGDPPSTETILAYSRGELSGDEEARVRELLACYPELAGALTIPFGESDPPLPEQVIARQWRSFRQQLPVPHPVPWIWPASAALAAVLALTFGALLWQAQSEFARPRVIAAEQILNSHAERGGRGGATTVLSADAGDVLLIASLNNQPRFAAYRIDVTEVAGTTRRQRWSTIAAMHAYDDGLRILIPPATLKPGEYEIVVYGIEAGSPRQLARYPVRVERRQDH
jgi:hypothetical protein